MAHNETIDILNELLAAEQTSIVERLLASTVFVSWASADEYPLVQRMTREVGEHCEWLGQLILDLRGGLHPRANDPASADLHYQELGSLLPRVIEDEKAIVAKYETAHPRLAAEPRAAEVVWSILARHREHIDQLTRFHRATT